MLYKLYLRDFLCSFSIMFIHLILSVTIVHSSWLQYSVPLCAYSTPYLTALPLMVIWVVSRGLFLPHKSNPISFLLTMYLQHVTALQIVSKLQDLAYSILNNQVLSVPLASYLLSLHLLVSVMGNFYRSLQRPCTFLPQVFYLKILSSLPYSHP